MDPQLQCRVVEVEMETCARGRRRRTNHVAGQDDLEYEYSNGFAIDDERIVTSAHGIDGARSIHVRFLAGGSCGGGGEPPQLSVEKIWNGYEHRGKFDVTVLRIR